MKKSYLLLFVLMITAVIFSCNSQTDQGEKKLKKSENNDPYYFSTTLEGDYDTVIMIVKEGLKKEGFGIITEINMKDKLKEKLDVDIQKYTILGACNPPYAFQALQVENKIGTMLPCNVVVQEVGESLIEVAAVNPIASMQAIQNKELAGIAMEVTEKLERFIDELEYR